MQCRSLYDFIKHDMELRGAADNERKNVLVMSWLDDEKIFLIDFPSVLTFSQPILCCTCSMNRVENRGKSRHRVVRARKAELHCLTSCNNSKRRSKEKKSFPILLPLAFLRLRLENSTKLEMKKAENIFFFSVAIPCCKPFGASRYIWRQKSYLGRELQKISISRSLWECTEVKSRRLVIKSFKSSSSVLDDLWILSLRDWSDSSDEVWVWWHLLWDLTDFAVLLAVTSSESRETERDLGKLLQESS